MQSVFSVEDLAVFNGITHWIIETNLCFAGCGHCWIYTQNCTLIDYKRTFVFNKYSFSKHFLSTYFCSWLIFVFFSFPLLPIIMPQMSCLGAFRVRKVECTGQGSQIALLTTVGASTPLLSNIPSSGGELEGFCKIIINITKLPSLKTLGSVTFWTPPLKKKIVLLSNKSRIGQMECPEVAALANPVGCL